MVFKDFFHMFVLEKYNNNQGEKTGGENHHQNIISHPMASSKNNERR